MFKRRHKRTMLQSIRAWLWPHGGWGRAAQYMGHRIGRIPDTPYRIAAGFACGAAVSFTPLMGMHIILAIILAFAMRANFLAASVGTIVGNPWTFPLIWAIGYEFGNFLLSRPTDLPLMSLIDTDLMFTSPWQAIEPVFFPLMLGGITMGVIAWFVFYYIVRVLVAAYQARRKAKIQSHKENEVKP